MKTVTLAGRDVPALGMGAWKIGESSRLRSQELAALKRGIELGMTLIDTAEMYGEGASEELIGEAIQSLRDRVYLVSKVYPHNAGRRAAITACDRSRKRLGVDCIDLYLLHWRGSVPLAETLDVFAELKRTGKIGAFGESNFDTEDMDEARSLPHGREIATDQILYNLTRRGVEHDLLPWLRVSRVPVMAYSPVEQGRLARNPKLAAIAGKCGATPAQVALAWVLAQPDVIAIPKSGDRNHVEENRLAAEMELTPEEMAALDEAFPRPKGRKPLEVL